MPTLFAASLVEQVITLALIAYLMLDVNTNSAIGHGDDVTVNGQRETVTSR